MENILNSENDKVNYAVQYVKQIIMLSILYKVSCRYGRGRINEPMDFSLGANNHSITFWPGLSYYGVLFETLRDFMDTLIKNESEVLSEKYGGLNAITSELNIFLNDDEYDTFCLNISANPNKVKLLKIKEFYERYYHFGGGMRAKVAPCSEFGGPERTAVIRFKEYVDGLFDCAAWKVLTDSKFTCGSDILKNVQNLKVTKDIRNAISSNADLRGIR